MREGLERSRIGGWLAFFIGTLCFNAVVVTLLALDTSSSLDVPLPPHDPRWKSYMLLIMLAAVGAAIAYLFLAWLLVHRERAGTPIIAITLLWPASVLPPLVEYVGGSALLGGIPNYFTGNVDPFTWSSVAVYVSLRSVYPAIWTAYLLSSKRVANTYASGDQAGLQAVFE